MRLNLPYGNSSINVELNQGHKAQVLTPHEIPALRYPTHAILEAMENPAGEGLSSIVGRGTNVTIVISDVTRPVPTSLILPPLIRELGRLGVLDEDIRIVTATGLHRGHTDEERAYLVGQEIFRHFKIIDHDARSSTDLTNLGKTSRGTPITVNNTVLDADVRIVISYVAPHPRAGFSGGRKSIIPGVSGEKSIAAIHRPEWMDDPNCVYGMLEGNPMHTDMVEYARIVGVDFTINAVLNSQKQLAGVFAGGLDSAFSEAVRHSRKVNVVQTPRQADVPISYRVSAYNSWGEGNKSASVTTTPLNALSEVTVVEPIMPAIVPIPDNYPWFEWITVPNAKLYLIDVIRADGVIMWHGYAYGHENRVRYGDDNHTIPDGQNWSLTQGQYYFYITAINSRENPPMPSGFAAWSPKEISISSSKLGRFKIVE
jgi:nickel-dependent lactate racemase